MRTTRKTSKTRRRTGAAKAEAKTAQPTLLDPQSVETLTSIQEAELEPIVALVDVYGDEFYAHAAEFDAARLRADEEFELPDAVDERCGGERVTEQELDDLIAALETAKKTSTTRFWVDDDGGVEQEISLEDNPSPTVTHQFTFACALYDYDEAVVRWHADEGEYVLKVGCQEHTLRYWRERVDTIVKAYFSDADDDGDRPPLPRFRYSYPNRSDYKTMTGFQNAVMKHLAEQESVYQSMVSAREAWDKAHEHMPTRLQRVANDLPILLDAIEEKLAAATVPPKRGRRAGAKKRR
jgi:hypothetical protein